MAATIQELHSWASQHLMDIQNAISGEGYDREDRRTIFLIIYHLGELNAMNSEDHQQEYIIKEMGSEEEFENDIEIFKQLKNKIEEIEGQGQIGGRRRLRNHKTRRVCKTKKARKTRRYTRAH